MCANCIYCDAELSQQYNLEFDNSITVNVCNNCGRAYCSPINHVQRQFARYLIDCGRKLAELQHRYRDAGRRIRGVFISPNSLENEVMTTEWNPTDLNVTYPNRIYSNDYNDNQITHNSAIIDISYKYLFENYGNPILVRNITHEFGHILYWHIYHKLRSTSKIKLWYLLIPYIS